ncbi:MAG: hypothetical protein ACI4E1_03855, partial [Lachnospira sp.]
LFVKIFSFFTHFACIIQKIVVLLHLLTLLRHNLWRNYSKPLRPLITAQKKMMEKLLSIIDKE